MAKVIRPCTLLVARVPVVLPIAPWLARVPDTTDSPPPLPLAVPKSRRSVTLPRPAFAQAEPCGVALSVALLTICTISALSAVVLPPGNVTDVEAAAATSPATTFSAVPRVWCVPLMAKVLTSV